MTAEGSTGAEREGTGSTSPEGRSRVSGQSGSENGARRPGWPDAGTAHAGRHPAPRRRDLVEASTTRSTASSLPPAGRRRPPRGRGPRRRRRRRGAGGSGAARRRPRRARRPHACPWSAIHESALGARREHGLLDFLHPPGRGEGGSGHRLPDRAPGSSRRPVGPPRPAWSSGWRSSSTWHRARLRRRQTVRCPCDGCSSAGSSKAHSDATRGAQPPRHSMRPRSSTCARI